MNRSVGETPHAAVFGLEMAGVHVAVEVGAPELVAQVGGALLGLAWLTGGRPGAGAVFAIDRGTDGGYRVAEPGAGVSFRSDHLEEALARLLRGVLDYVALHAPGQVLVSGAAVVVEDHAIVLLGGAGSQLSALVQALMSDGAVRYADGHVPIDTKGCVHPAIVAPPSDEQAAGRARGPASIGLIATLVGGDELALCECSPDEGLRDFLGHVRRAEARPEFALAIARMAVLRAVLVAGEWDRAELASAALIERLAGVTHEPSQGRSVPPEAQFAALVLQLEARLGQLAEALKGAEVDAVLLNGDQVRPALAYRFALSFSALVEVPRSQMPRALGVIESAGWRPVPGEDGARFCHGGVTVRLLPRPRLPLGRERWERRSVVRGRLGFDEPNADAASRGDQVPPAQPVPVPIGRGRPVRPGVIAEALTLSAEALTVLDTLRLRTRERDFRGLPVQYGPGVHAFQNVLEWLVDVLLARLPDDRSGLRVVDVGTGTGIVALSVARQRPDVQVLATDVSLRALGWARRNRRRLGVGNVRLAQGSLLAPVPPEWRGRVAAVVAHLPNAAPASPPEFGTPTWPVGTATGPGADGLGLVRALARDARDVLAPDGLLVATTPPTREAWIVGYVAHYLEHLGYQDKAELPDNPRRKAELPDEPSGSIHVARWPGPHSA